MINFKSLTNGNSYIWLIKNIAPYKLMLFIITSLSIISSLSNVAMAIVSRSLVDGSGGGSTNHLVKYGSILASLFILQIIASSLIAFLTSRLRESMRNDLQFNFLKNIYNTEWLLINEYKTGDILTRITSDISSIIEIWATIFPSLISLILQLITAFIVLMSYDNILALFALMISPLCIIISLLIGNHLKKIQSQVQKAESVFQSFITESLQNIIILKIFEYIHSNLTQVKNYQQNKYDLILKRTKFSIGTNIIVSLGYRFGYFFALLLGAYRLSMKSISFGTFTAFLQLVGQVQGPMDGLVRTIPQIISGLASVDRLMEINSLEQECSNELSSNLNPMPVAININNITFGYTKETLILKNISLIINSGQIIGIVGSSGGGKTTLIRILLALIKPQLGYISIEFENNLSLPFSSYTRRFFSYVPQGNSLFSGSIISNLRVAKHDASEKEFNRALTTSCCLEFIKELPDGINTIIGERGIGLSEGQAQRLSIARALLHNAPFLILDEATSALDIATETKLIENLKLNYPKTTIIAITHRESIFKICDFVYRIENGKLTPLTFNISDQ
jgi:ATP-binding cassette subfamily B protein